MASLPPLVTLRNILRGAARLGEDADQYRGRRWSLSLMTLGATSRQSSKSTPGPDAPIFAAAASERHCDQGRATAGRSSPARPRPAQKAVLGAAVSVGLTSTAPVRQRKRLRNAARPGNRECLPWSCILYRASKSRSSASRPPLANVQAEAFVGLGFADDPLRSTDCPHSINRRATAASARRRAESAETHGRDEPAIRYQALPCPSVSTGAVGSEST